MKKKSFFILQMSNKMMMYMLMLFLLGILVGKTVKMPKMPKMIAAPAGAAPITQEGYRQRRR